MQPRLESSGSNNLPYHVQIKNVKCASIWCKHRNVQCAITTQDEKTRTNEKKKNRKTETQLQLHTKRDQRTTGRMKHIFFGVFDASLHQFMQIRCRQTSWYKTFIYYYVKKFTIKGLKRRPKRLSMNFEYIYEYIFFLDVSCCSFRFCQLTQN